MDELNHQKVQLEKQTKATKSLIFTNLQAIVQVRQSGLSLIDQIESRNPDTATENDARASLRDQADLTVFYEAFQAFVAEGIRLNKHLAVLQTELDRVNEAIANEGQN
jgi:hypothetical protein